MPRNLTYALTIAGFDGSAGAGYLADVKTMAHFGVYGQAVCTALTIQNESEFLDPGWIPVKTIEAQLQTLFKKHEFHFVKIGLIQNAQALKRVVDFVREKVQDAFIIWDPIASATAGFNFLDGEEREKFLDIMKKIDLVTPNFDEFRFLGLESAVKCGKISLGKDFAVLLKGGHTQDVEAVDTLFAKDGQSYRFASPRIPGAGKHGTGCNLSSAILANVALGKTLPEACKTAKNYMSEFIVSGEGRLGFIWP
ncbi:MAG: hydroxymethylpyrimidine/phosphomethylpyrimidine kinase [Fibrobacter sp.]|nr:hydroxymethylpyrimidine/phosphomethylpyrimidine kinase [Fibrobacter sp.]